MLSKFTEDNSIFWDYDSYIRSAWGNEDEFDKIIGLFGRNARNNT